MVLCVCRRREKDVNETQREELADFFCLLEKNSFQKDFQPNVSNLSYCMCDTD
jgi:hypothetical protein